MESRPEVFAGCHTGAGDRRADQQQAGSEREPEQKRCLADSLLQQMFVVRFLGSMAVKTDTTTEVIYEAMRQVLAARAIHNIFRTTESHLMVTSQTLRYLGSFQTFLQLYQTAHLRHIYSSGMFILEYLFDRSEDGTLISALFLFTF